MAFSSQLSELVNHHSPPACLTLFPVLLICQAPFQLTPRPQTTCQRALQEDCSPSKTGRHLPRKLATSAAVADQGQRKARGLLILVGSKDAAILERGAPRVGGSVHHPEMRPRPKRGGAPVHPSTINQEENAPKSPGIAEKEGISLTKLITRDTRPQEDTNDEEAGAVADVIEEANHPRDGTGGMKVVEEHPRQLMGTSVEMNLTATRVVRFAAALHHQMIARTEDEMSHRD